MRVSPIRISQRNVRDRFAGVHPTLAVVVVAAAMMLTACGSGAKQTPVSTATVPQIAPATATAATTLPKSTPATPVVHEGVIWSTTIDPVTGAPGGAVTKIPQSAKTVYAFVQTNGLPAGTTVTATWTIDGTPIPGISQSMKIEPAHGAGWIEFHLDWTAGGSWPRGALGISVAIDGKPVSSGSVQIVTG